MSTPYSDEELQALIAMSLDGVKPTLIAETLGRSCSSIYKRRQDLDLPPLPTGKQLVDRERVAELTRDGRSTRWIALDQRCSTRTVTRIRAAQRAELATE